MAGSELLRSHLDPVPSPSSREVVGGYPRAHVQEPCMIHKDGLQPRGGDGEEDGSHYGCVRTASHLAFHESFLSLWSELKIMFFM